jgi:hypothetical protein
VSGLHRKFIISRTDGSDTAGGKHDGCEYFVLDLTHDPDALAALRAYAFAAEATRPDLVADLRQRYDLGDAVQRHVCDYCRQRHDDQEYAEQQADAMAWWRSQQ